MDAARAEVLARINGTGLACWGLQLNSSSPEPCERCWSFSFAYECRAGDNRSRVYYADVFVDSGRVASFNSKAMGLTCIFDGDCVPAQPKFDTRYFCNGGVCAEGIFDDPAARYCREMDSRMLMRRQPSASVYSVCRFPNGNECEAWSYYYRMCTPLTENLTDCSSYIGNRVCSGEYNPVCARVERTVNSSRANFSEGYANPCAACISTTNEALVAGYRMGECPPTTTTLKSSIITNAASLYCQSMGYIYRIKQYPSGREYGVCVFGLEDECPAEEYFHGSCKPKRRLG